MHTIQEYALTVDPRYLERSLVSALGMEDGLEATRMARSMMRGGINLTPEVMCIPRTYAGTLSCHVECNASGEISGLVWLQDWECTLESKVISIPAPETVAFVRCQRGTPSLLKIAAEQLPKRYTRLMGDELSWNVTGGTFECSWKEGASAIQAAAVTGVAVVDDLREEQSVLLSMPTETRLVIAEGYASQPQYCTFAVVPITTLQDSLIRDERMYSRRRRVSKGSSLTAFETRSAPSVLWSSLP